MNIAFSVSTADAGERDEPPGVGLVELLAGLATGPRALLLLEAYVLGGASVRLDLASLSRATGAARSSLSRAKTSLVREGVFLREEDGSVSLAPYAEWPSLQSRPALLSWIERPPAGD